MSRFAWEPGVPIEPGEVRMHDGLPVVCMPLDAIEQAMRLALLRWHLLDFRPGGTELECTLEGFGRLRPLRYTPCYRFVYCLRVHGGSEVRIPRLRFMRKLWKSGGVWFLNFSEVTS